MVYCCAAKGSKILYCYSSKEQDLESLVLSCLENAPAYHRWYFHTVKTRTFGFLMEDGYTFFAIVDPSVGNVAILNFLRHFRDEYIVLKNGFVDELKPVVKQLTASLEKLPQDSFFMDEEHVVPFNGNRSPSTKTPLLRKNSGKHHDKKKKMKDKAIENADTIEVRTDRAVNISEPTGVMSLQRSSSSTRLRSQQMARKLWLQHVKIVFIVDVILCLVLLAIWLAACGGLHCISK